MAIAVDLKFGNFPEGSLEEGEMMWMMILAVWALGVFFMICMLILGKRADRRQEVLLMDRCGDLQKGSAFSLSPRRAGGALQKWGSLRPQHNHF
jgi:hypothetical protein